MSHRKNMLSVAVLSEWLTMSEVAMCDVAICNKKLRVNFLEQISNDSTVFLGHGEAFFPKGSLFHLRLGEAYFDWLKLRNMKVSNMYIDQRKYPMITETLLWHLDHPSFQSVTTLSLRCDIGVACYNCDAEMFGDSISYFTLMTISRVFPKLHYLTLINCSIARPHKNVTLNFPNLQSLRISHCQSSNELLNIFIQSAPQLQKLKLEQIKETHKTDHKSILPYTGWKEVDLSGYDVPHKEGKDNTTILSIIDGSKDLHTLNLSGCKVFSEEYVCETLSKFTQIQNINLSNVQNLTDYCIIMLVDSCPLLRIVEISHNSYLFECIAYLLKHAQHLETLHVRKSSQKFHFGLDLEKSCSELKYVDFRETAITDDYVRSLVSHSPKLHTLLLDHCYDISDDVMDMLKKDKVKTLSVV